MTKTKWIVISLGFVVFFFLFLSFGTNWQKQDAVLRIGDSVILTEEFNHRLNLSPAINTDDNEYDRSCVECCTILSKPMRQFYDMQVPVLHIVNSNNIS